jgi:hypothetical protein
MHAMPTHQTYATKHHHHHHQQLFLSCVPGLTNFSCWLARPCPLHLSDHTTLDHLSPACLLSTPR